MHFAYGWPKLLRGVDHSSHRDVVVNLSAGGEYMLLVTSTVLQVWTSGQVGVMRL